MSTTGGAGLQRRELDVDGTPIRWLEMGTGFPVVLIHGIPTSPLLWRHVAPLVAGHSLAFEMVGYGSSIPAGHGRDISVAAQAGHLLRWLDALTVDRAVFVGHDLGGGVAQIAAIRQPDRCAGLLLTNSIGYDSWPIPSVKVMRALGPVFARLPEPAFRLLLRSLFHRGHDDRRRAEEALATHWPPYAEHGGAAAMVRQVRALDVADTLAVQDRLPTLDVPVRIVWGTADRFQKVGYGERFARDLRAELRRIEGAKHWTPADHPADIAAAINELLVATDQS